MTAPTLLHSSQSVALQLDSYEEHTYGKPLIYHPRELSYFGKLISWIRKDDRHHLFKIIITAITTFATLVLCLSIVGIPLVLKGIRENNIQELDQRKKVKFNTIFPVILGTRRAVMEAVGGPDAYNRLPALNIRNSVGTSGYIDFLTPADLNAPVMRGEDRYGRPFISLKIQEVATGTTFVLTLFQRYLDQPYWVWGGPINVLGTTNGAVLEPQSLTNLRQLVLDENHPRFQLATIC